MIRAPSHTADLRHVVLYSFGNSIHLLVAGLTALEEDVRVDRGAAGSGMLRIQGVGPEGFQGFHINQGTQLLVIQCFNLLNLMRGAESIKEMQERHPTVDGGKVCHGAQIHDFLWRRGCQHSKACAADTHHIGMVAEDGQGVNREGAGGDMEYTRQHLACDLIHIGDHQQQALRGSISGGQSSRLERAMNCAGGTAFRLHFNHLYWLTKEVFLSIGSPFIHILCHRR